MRRRFDDAVIQSYRAPSPLSSLFFLVFLLFFLSFLRPPPPRPPPLPRALLISKEGYVVGTGNAMGE